MVRGRVLLFLITLILIANVGALPVINEIMPHSNNSLGDEWVELYNPGSSTLTLSKWMIGDKISNDTISLNISAYGFAIITDSSIGCSSFNIPNESCVELSTIGSGLNDDEETVYLYNNSLVDSFSWDKSIKSTGDSWQIYNSNWEECTPTPATTNNCITIQNQTQNETTQSLVLSTQSSSTESSLSIIDAPTRASFGETIDVEITAYRGDTAKYAIYLYVKKDNDIISEKVSLHLDDKFKNYSFTVPLKIKPNCDAAYDEGTYAVILEGLDKIALEDITLKGNAECESEESLKRGKVSYKIDFPDEIEVGKEFIVSVEIYNNQNKRQQFSAWSYVYQNNNCYSCGNKTREANAEQAIIDEYESATLFLKNTVYNAEGGVYKLKVKVLREGYETTKDFTFDLFVKNIQQTEENRTSTEATAESILNESAINESTEQSKVTGKVVYKADKKSPLTTLFLFIILCLLLLLYFMLKKKSTHKEEKEGLNKDSEEDKDDFGDSEEEATQSAESDTNKEGEINSSEEEATESESSEDKTEKPVEGEEIKTESEKEEDGT